MAKSSPSTAPLYYTRAAAMMLQPDRAKLRAHCSPEANLNAYLSEDTTGKKTSLPATVMIASCWQLTRKTRRSSHRSCSDPCWASRPD